MGGGGGAPAALLGELLHLAHVDEAADSKNDTRGPVLDDGGLLDFAHLRGHQVSRDRSLPAGPLRGLRAASRPPEPVPSPKRSSQTRVPGPEAGTARSTAPREGGRGLEAACGRAGAAPIDKHRSRSPSCGLFDPRAPAFFRARPCSLIGNSEGPGPCQQPELSRADAGGDGGGLETTNLVIIHPLFKNTMRKVMHRSPRRLSSNKIAGVPRTLPPPRLLFPRPHRPGPATAPRCRPTPQSPALDGEDASRSLGPPTCGAYTQPLAGP